MPTTSSKDRTRTVPANKPAPAPHQKPGNQDKSRLPTLASALAAVLPRELANAFDPTVPAVVIEPSVAYQAANGYPPGTLENLGKTARGFGSEPDVAQLRLRSNDRAANWSASWAIKLQNIIRQHGVTPEITTGRGGQVTVAATGKGAQ